MRVAGIIRDSLVNGPGIRDVIFLQGCSHHCKGCHNPETWNYNGGYPQTIDEIVNKLSDSKNDVTISGGEPLDQLDDLLLLCKRFKEQGKHVWVYTGYKFSLAHKYYHILSNYVDVIVDGEFIEELKDTNLTFKGSRNQRIIDLPLSVKLNTLIHWFGDDIWEDE